MIKHTGSLRFRNKDYTVNGRTFRTVRGDRTHGIFFFAFTLGYKCRRTTTIAVNRVNATECKHHFAHFIVRKAGRNRSVTSVNLTENKCTVSLNTDHRTRRIGRSTFHCLGLKNTVFYQPAEVGRNSSLFGTIKRCTHRAKLTVTFPVDNKVGLCTLMYFRRTKHNTIPYHITVRCIRIVCKCGVHGANYVVSQGFVVSNSLCKLFSLPIRRLISNTIKGKIIGIELIDTIITRKHLNVFVFGVNFEIVNNLTVSALCIVQNQFNFVGTITENIFVLRQYIEVVTCN